MQHPKKQRTLSKPLKKSIVKGSWILAIVLLFLLTLLKFQDLLIITTLILIGAVSIIYKLFLKMGIGLELILFVTVLGSMQYGSLTGMLIAILSTILGYTLCLKITENPLHLITRILALLVVAFFGGFFSLNFFFLYGMIASVFFLFFIFTAELFLGGSPSKLITYGLTYLVFNYFFFSQLGPLAIHLIS